MSYDLIARSDSQYSGSVSRAEAARAVAALPDVSSSGLAAYVLRRDQDLYMEIDLELVSEEGDSLEQASPELSTDVNCVQFSIPCAFIGELDRCRETAQAIAGRLGWELHDPQGDEEIPAMPPARRPWWRFW